MLFLPIGSVVILKNASKKIMITGYSVKDKNTNKEYDYVGCKYPEGITVDRSYLLFNSEDIAKVFYKGYMDEEFNEIAKSIDVETL